MGDMWYDIIDFWPPIDVSVIVEWKDQNKIIHKVMTSLDSQDDFYFFQPAMGIDNEIKNVLIVLDQHSAITYPQYYDGYALRWKHICLRGKLTGEEKK